MRTLIVSSFLCLVACDAGTKPEPKSAPPGGSGAGSAPAPAPPTAATVPAGWVAIVPTDEQRRCSNRADDEWQVVIDANAHVDITKAAREPDTGPALPFQPKNGEVRGRRHTLEFGDGYLVGFDAGEWGGSLSWFRRDGTGQQPLGQENVHALVQLGPDLAVSLEGLAHLSINEGAVRWIERSGKTFQAAKTTPLPDAPHTLAKAADGSIYVLTWSSLVKVTADRHVDVVQKIETDGLYANSMAIDGAGALWIGMRQFVLRLTPSGTRFTETWFVRESCQHMQIVDMDCVCH